MRILLTAFGPFPGVADNLTGWLIGEIGRRAANLPGIELAICIFDTVWAAAPGQLTRALSEHRPDVALHFGVSSRVQHVQLEARAHNSCDACADAAGAMPLNARILDDGPASLETVLPVTGLHQKLAGAGLPCVISDHAGAYLCNAVYYRSLHAGQVAGGRHQALFVHVPACLAGGAPGGTVPEQDGALLTGAQVISAGGALIGAVRDTCA